MDVSAAATPSSPRVLVLWDDQALLSATVAFIHAAAGEDAHLILQPVGSSPAGAGWPAIDPAAVELLAPISAVPDAIAEIGEIARSRSVVLIALATVCCSIGAMDHACGATPLALDSPIPVLLLRSPELAGGTIQPVSRVLVPLDGSARAAQALPLATTFARKLHVPVRFVMVIDPARVLPPAYAYDPQAQDMIANLREMAHWALKQAERQLERDDVTSTSSLHYGPIATCIESAIESGDMIVMTTHGTGRAVEGRLGSVAAALLARITNPLVIARSRPPSDVVTDQFISCPWIETVSSATVASRI